MITGILLVLEIIKLNFAIYENFFFMENFFCMGNG